MLYQLSYASLISPETGLPDRELNGHTYSRHHRGTEVKINTGLGPGQTGSCMENMLSRFCTVTCNLLNGRPQPDQSPAAAMVLKLKENR